MTNRAPDFLSADEMRELALRSDLRGLVIVAFNWTLVFGALALAARFPNPLAWLIALIVLGGRQLGLGILMHDCAHRALFRTRALNELAGKWLCAAPIWADLEGYRLYHLKHHHAAGTPDDPDRPNYQGYPVGKKSFARKVLRDLTGVTGVKTFLILVTMLVGARGYDMAYKENDRRGLDGRTLLKNIPAKLLPPLAVTAAIFLFCRFALNSGAVFSLWPLAYLTTYMLFSRVRNAAEHAVVPDASSPDPLLNTRTTLARWWERLTVAPNRVNFHLEHHILMHVPPYRLPRLHAFIAARGAYATADLCRGYGEVVRKLVSAPTG